MKRTSLGVCKREEVTAKMFSGAKNGSVEKRAITAAMERMLSAREAPKGVD